MNETIYILEREYFNMTGTTIESIEEKFSMVTNIETSGIKFHKETASKEDTLKYLSTLQILIDRLINRLDIYNNTVLINNPNIQSLID